MSDLLLKAAGWASSSRVLQGVKERQDESILGLTAVPSIWFVATSGCKASKSCRFCAWG